MRSLVVVALLSACSGAESPAPAPVEGTTAPQAKEAVTVALNWFPEPEFGGIYEAKLGGLYDEKGLDVTIAEGSASAGVVQQVATGRVAFGISVADEVVLANAQGTDVVTIFGTFQHHPSCIMVHESRHLASLADLKTGTLAVEDGIPFAPWLKKKLDLSKVQIVPYGGGVAQWMLDPNYAQQAYITSEPIVAKKAGGDPQCFLVSDTGYDPYADVVITSRKYLTDHPDTVRAFVAATQRGWEQYLADGTRANGKIGELNRDLDKDTLQAMWDAQKPLIASGDAAKAGLGTMDEARWTTLIGQLQEAGVLTGTAPTAASCFTNEFLPVKQAP
jgi:NitT/TauT family transport system substrate-binding protein